MGADLITRSLEVMKIGGCEFKKQDKAFVTYAPKLFAKDGHIVWKRTSSEIRNQVRGLTPRPGAYTMFKEKRLEVLQVLPEIGNREAEIDILPGQIIALEKNRGPVVKTGDGTIILLEVKPQGKKAMSGDEFIRGYKPSVGEQLL